MARVVLIALLSLRAIPSAASSVPGGDVVARPPYAADPALTNLGAPRGVFVNFTLDMTTATIFNGTDPTFAVGACDGPTPAECCHKAPRPPGVNACAVNFNRSVLVYIPARYVDGGAAPVLVLQDGPGYAAEASYALDNLAARASPRYLPAFVVVSLENGGCDAIGSERGLEYDTVSDRYARFLSDDVLPSAAAAVRAVGAYPHFAFSANASERGLFGCSSGGAAAMIAAFTRPDLFTRVAAYSATLVDQQNHADQTGAFAAHPQGAWGFHSGQQLLARASPRPPLRVFHSANEHDLGFNLSSTAVDDATPSANNTAGDPGNWSDGHHNWREAGNRTAAALRAAGYPYRHVFALGVGHCDGSFIRSSMADTLAWLWEGVA